MSEPFLGEIRMVAFNFPPRGWASCDGQILPINQYQSLYSLLGTTYGGDGRTSFALPDLRSRTPIHWGHGAGLISRTLGQKSGSQTETLTAATLPNHTHQLKASNSPGTQRKAANAVPAATVRDTYSTAGPLTGMSTGAVTASAGGTQGHNNMQPYLAVYFVIALQGVFPSRN